MYTKRVGHRKLGWFLTVFRVEMHSNLVIRILIRNNSAPHHATWLITRDSVRQKPAHRRRRGNQRLRPTKHKQDRVQHVLNQDPKFLHHDGVIDERTRVPTGNAVDDKKISVRIQQQNKWRERMLQGPWTRTFQELPQR